MLEILSHLDAVTHHRHYHYQHLIPVFHAGMSRTVQQELAGQRTASTSTVALVWFPQLDALPNANQFME